MNSNNTLRVEIWQLIALVVIIISFGFSTGYWALSIILPVIAYLFWLLYQLYHLNKWMMAGAKNGAIPVNSGIWESVATQVLKWRKLEKSHQKRLTKIAKGYRNAVLALPDAVLVLNENLEIEWGNAIANQLLGINYKLDKGYRISNLIRHPEFVHFIFQSGADPLEMDSPTDPEIILSVRVTHYGQDQRLLVARDISERVRARNALQAFVSNASHELHTPLTVTSGYIDILNSDSELPEHLRKAVVQMREQTDNMSLLINDLLTLSKLEGNILGAFEGKPINVSERLAQITSDFEKTQKTATRELSVSANTSLVLLGIDQEISSIMHNLISNAIKYTTPEARIDIHWHLNQNKQPEFSVRDSGEGFDKKYIALITKRFYRINQGAHPDVEGTGLGLAIVKHAVQRHGGELLIESKPGEYALFKVVFPQYRKVDLS